LYTRWNKKFECCRIKKDLSGVLELIQNPGNNTNSMILSLLLAFLTILSSCRQGGQSDSIGETGIARPPGISCDSLIDYSALDTLVFIPDNRFYEAQDILEVVRFIKLETNAECLIGSVGKVQFVNGLFYLLDDYTGQNAIHVFDTLGNHVRSLKRIGRGPGEYKDILDFDIDDNLSLYILNSIGNILVYDSLFQYRKTINQEIAVRMISIFNGFIIGITHGSTYKNPQGKVLHILSLEGRPLKEFLTYPEGSSNFTNPASALSRSNGRVFANIPFSPTIFSIDSSLNVKAEFCLVFNYDARDGRTANRFNTDPFKSFFYSDKLISCGTSIPLGSIYLKNMGFSIEGQTFLPTVVRDRISEGAPNPLPLLGMTEAGIGISVQEAHHLKYCLENDGMEVITDSTGARRRVYSNNYLGGDTLPGSLYDKIRHLDENDNPCIILVKIKPFPNLNESKN